MAIRNPTRHITLTVYCFPRRDQECNHITLALYDERAAPCCEDPWLSLYFQITKNVLSSKHPFHRRGKPEQMSSTLRDQRHSQCKCFFAAALTSWSKL